MLVLFPTLLILQTLGPGSFLFAVDAFNQSAIEENFRYAANFDQAGSVQRYKKHSPGPKPRSNFIINSPGTGSYSIVHHTTNKRRMHPVVRTAATNTQSQVSNHFSLGKDSMKFSKLSQTNFSEKKSQTLDNNHSKLLTNEVYTRSPVSRVVVRKRKNKNKPEDKGIAKLISSTFKLVSNDDVVNINGAAEEYFDEISDEQVNNSVIDFRDKLAHPRNSSLPRPNNNDEIITNSLLYPSSRSLQADESKVITSSIRVDALPNSSKTPAPRISVEILNENNRPYDFGDRIASRYLDASTEISIFSSASVAGPSTLSYYLPENITESLKSDDNKTTKNDQTIGKATTISVAFLAPLQAGFLLYSDESHRANTNELEDNVLSDTIQNDQAVVNSIAIVNKTDVLQNDKSKLDEDKAGNQLATTVVESYRSNPVVEIVEKSIDGSAAGKITEQTYFYSTITHTNDETPLIPIKIRPSAIKLDLNEAEIEVTTDVNTLSANGILRKPIPVAYFGPPLFSPQFQPPSTALKNNFGAPFRLPSGSPIPLQMTYRTPQNSFFFTQTLHSPVGQIKANVVKDDYWGPVPPINEHSIWNTMHVRQQRQLTDVGIPRIEYGFKPLMRPSLEINEDGLPLVGN